MLIINRLGLLDEYQLEESIMRKIEEGCVFIEYGFLGQDLGRIWDEYSEAEASKIHQLLFAMPSN